MSRPLIAKNGNDKIYTPVELAKKIVANFKLEGVVLEPCKGTGAFYTAFPSYIKKEWCEIDAGKDFFDFQGKVDWVITNPPYSQFRKFLQHSMEVADNVVFLCLINALWMKARLRDIEKAEFGIKEIILIETPETWPKFGLQVGVIYLKRKWSGDIKLLHIN